MSRDMPDMLSAAEIADQIARTRARLSHSLMILDREYALRNAVVHGFRLLHGSEGDVRHVGDMARRHIVPFSLIGAGLVWLAFAGKDDVAGRLLRAIGRVQRLGRELLAVVEPSRGEQPATPPRKEAVDEDSV